MNKLVRMGAGLLVGVGLSVWGGLAGVSAQTPSYVIVPVQVGSEVKGAVAADKPLVMNTTALPPYAPMAQGYQSSDVEPNGTSATASPLPGGDIVVRGNLYPNGDIDYFSFTANAGDRVYAAVMTSFSAGSATDSQLTLLAADGTTVIEFDDDNGSFAGLSSTIAGSLIPTTGTYYLRVNNFTAGTTSMRGYELHFRIQSGAPTPEAEPNDTPATATPLPSNGWVSGARDPAAATEQDWYSLSLNAGDTVFLSLDLDPERDNVSWNGRLGFGLFGDASNQILVVDDAGTGDAAPNPNIPSEAMFFTVKDAGTYFAFVDSATAATGGPTATYHLSVSVHPATEEVLNCTTYSSTDVPKTIGPGTGLSSSILTVPGNPRIADVDVTIELNHALMQDVDAVLHSPAGTAVQLFSDIGASATGGQIQMHTTFDDEAGITPSFTVLRGSQIKPENNSTAGTASTSGAARLSWFDGQDAGGTWTLDLYDDTAGANGGTLTNWSVRICEVPPPPSCPAGFAPTTVYGTDFEADDGGFTSSGTANEWERGLPATVGTSTANPIAEFNTCNSGSNCWKTDLDNPYDASSNQDLYSPNINLAGLSAPVVVSWAQRHQVEAANFDHFFVDYEEVGGGGAVLRLFDWIDPTPVTASSGTGNPQVNLGSGVGWSERQVRADSLAGLNTRLRFHLDSDSSVQFAGAAIDDVRITACRALSADLAITKTDGVATAVPGGSTTYTITASNGGTDAVTGATVADTFPAALTCTWTCVNAGGGTCTASGSGNINDSVDLPVGGSVTYTATCAINAAATGTLSNTTTVASSVSDPVPANNSATDTDTLTPQADLAITKTDGVTNVTPGGSTTYTITASNVGPSNAPGATVADTFPAALTCAWTCVGAGGGTCTASGSGNINDSVNLPAGGSATYTASCTISNAASGALSNTATVAAPAGVTDPNVANNSATDTDTILAPGVLGVTPTSMAFGIVPVGDTSAAQVVTLSNSGASPLTVTALTAAVAPFTLAGGTCSAVPIVIAAGNSCTLLYDFSPSASGVVSQNLAVNAGGAGSGNIALSGEGGVGVLATSVASVDFGQIAPGTSTQQTISIQNTGTGPLDVTGLTGLTAPFTITGGTCGAPTFTIAAGMSCTVIVTFSPTVGGPITQTLTIVSDVGSINVPIVGAGLFQLINVDANSVGVLALLALLLALAGWVAIRRH